LIIIATIASSTQLERRSPEDIVIVLAENNVGYWRAFVATWWPTMADANSISLSGSNAYGSAVTSDTTLSNNITINQATFAAQTPASGNDFTFYFGYLQASTSWSVTSSDAFGSISGSLAEAVASFYSIIVYEDRDGQAGFQYALGSDVLQCDLGTGYDCVRTDAGFEIELSSLTWNPISANVNNCTSLLPSSASPGEQCYVTTWTFSTSDGGVVFDMTTTSHPVTISGKYYDPDSTKIDVSIAYNWTGKSCSGCKLGLTAATAGFDLSGSISFDELSSAGTTTTQFQASGGLAAFFNWDQGAAIAGTTSTVYYSAVTYANLEAWSCAPLSTTNWCLAPTAILNLAWEAILAIWNAFGWTGTMIIFSWNNTQPEQVFWDPTIGGSNSHRITDSDLPQSKTTASNSNDAPALFFSYALFQLVITFMNFW